jgi:holliday junction DNA helicase RuvA
VGYHVHASAKTLAQLPPRGEAVRLIIETHVREDHIHLYGFLSAAERDWFRTLTTVQGVGVKMALGILSGISTAALVTTIASGDKTALTRISGVGPKLAERLVTELKSKLGKLPASDFSVTSEPVAAPVKTSSKKTKLSVVAEAPASNISEDAVSALSHLGYARSEAFVAVAKALHAEPQSGLDTLIKRALRELAA